MGFCGRSGGSRSGLGQGGVEKHALEFGIHEPCFLCLSESLASVVPRFTESLENLHVTMSAFAVWNMIKDFLCLETILYFMITMTH